MTDPAKTSASMFGSIHTETFLDDVARCAAPDKHLIIDKQEFPIYHAVIGVASEAGELVDAIKKSHCYGKFLDLTNLDEEMGDVLWYIGLYCNARNISINQLMAQNSAKLKVRYPERWNAEQAETRDLLAERGTLEGKDMNQ